MEAVWYLSVKRGLGWGAHGECYTRAIKVQHGVMGPCYISPPSMLALHGLHILSFQFNHLWTISKPCSSKRERERERERCIDRYDNGSSATPYQESVI